jgi:hypothetical protein
LCRESFVTQKEFTSQKVRRKKLLEAFSGKSTDTMQFQRYQSHDDSMNYTNFLPGMGRISSPAVYRTRKSSYTDLKKLSAPPVVDSITTPVKSSMKKETDDVHKKSVAFQLPTRFESPTITYQVWPGGPYKKFVRPEDNKTTNHAATHIQRIVRGRCARTNYRIMFLEHKLANAEKNKEQELEAIRRSFEEKKLTVRRKATKKEAKTIKKALAVGEVASESTKIIQYLRAENKKLRAKNDKIAAAIHELRVQNARLESATEFTDENQHILGAHYAKIKETNDALNAVIPKYEANIAKFKEELETRNQYCQSEHSMKLMYVKLVGTLAEMVENHSKDQELIEEVVAMCFDLEGDMSESSKYGDLFGSKEQEDEDYEEVSVGEEER